MRGPIGLDLAKLTEDERIELIGVQAMVHRKECGVIVEDEQKADRYIEKLKAKFPDIAIKYNGKGPTKHTWLIRVGPPHTQN